MKTIKYPKIPQGTPLEYIITEALAGIVVFSGFYGIIYMILSEL